MGEVALEHATDAHGRKLLWTFGANDHVEELPADKLKEFKPSGSFRADFAGLSGKCGIATHPGFVPPPRKDLSVKFNTKGNQERKSAVPENASDKEGSVLALQSIMVGRAAMLVLRQVIPTALHLEVLRFTGCSLDIDALSLLRAGLTESCSIAVLQLDSNPVEIPIDASAVKAALEAEQFQQIDTLEKERGQQQTERNLRAFQEMLTSRFGDVSAALQSLQASAIAHRPHHSATACFEPFSLVAWADAFHEVLGLDAAETDRIFSMVDSSGDGFASFGALGTVLESVPVLEVEDESADPVGKAFAAFADSTTPLDVISFRHCRLSRIECVAMGKALSQTQHLRGINLFGNSICDLGAACLAEALETNQCLQFLGLGRNFITHIGLEKLCEPLGYTRLDDKAQADQIIKDVKDKAKEKDKWMKSRPAPKKDVHGGERYNPEFVLPTCEPQTDASGDFWVYCRNVTLKTLNVEHNPISDAAAVMKIQPFGVGQMHMKGVPCAAELVKLLAQPPVPAQSEAVGEEGDGASGQEPKTDGPYGPGWKIVLR